jgi:Tol biopolymer transport system component
MRRSTVLGVVLTTLLSLISTVGAADAKAPGPNGRLLFVHITQRCSDCHFTTIDPDGTDPDHIPGLQFARWSPDGSQLVTFAFLPDGRVTTELLDADGSNPVVFPIDDPTLNTACTIWSGEGSRLLCEAWDDVHPHRAPGIFSIDASDGSALVRLTSNTLGGHDLPADSSPDGTQIVFLREDPSRKHRPFHITVAGGDGSNPIPIGPWVRDIAGDVSWAPDGSAIIYSSKGSIWSIAPDGTGLVEVPVPTPNDDHYIFGPVWSPDGTRIAFSMSLKSTGQFDVFTAALDGSDLEQVTDGPSLERYVDWGPAPLVP